MKLSFAILILSALSTTAQDTLSVKKLTAVGYIKDLQTLSYNAGFDELVTGNLIHNRINVKWNPGGRITGAVEFRNRIFWGEEVRLTPGFSSYLRNPNEAVDLSFTLVDEEALIFNATIDRVWLQYDAEKWNIKAGRQRINWGIGSTWNPNDLFNTFNFLNVDYEEKPATDAIRIQRFTGLMDNIEVAVSFAEDPGKTIAAAKYFLNYRNYDIQFIGGWYHDVPTLGLGWAGSIGDVGFKGETQAYIPSKKAERQINICLEVDQVVGNWFLSGGVFFNSLGAVDFDSPEAIASLEFSPQMLMPTKWNLLAAVNKEISPLLSASFSSIFAPGTNLLMLLPTIRYNLATNLDFDLVWQSFFADGPNHYTDLGHRGFLRFKLSF